MRRGWAFGLMAGFAGVVGVLAACDEDSLPSSGPYVDGGPQPVLDARPADQVAPSDVEVPAVCDPGSVACDPDASALRTCNGAGSAVTVLPCSEGCLAGATACVAPLTVSAGADQNIAQDASVQLAAQAQGGVSPLTYGWTPSGFLDDAGTSSPLATPPSTTEYTVRVTDARGKVATDSVLVKVPDAPLVLTGWTTVQLDFPGGQPPGNWAVQPGGISVRQTVNSDPSIFLSDIQFSPIEVSGRFTMGSSSDDDLVGFVFGYQDRHHFYLFDWKRGTQAAAGCGTASIGMSVKRVDGTVDGGVGVPDAGNAFDCLDLWNSGGSVNVTTLSPASSNPIAWDYNKPYDFRLVHTPTSFLIEVRDGATVLATISGNDSRYPLGRFGFYNYSQDNVTYEFFKAKDP